MLIAIQDYYFYAALLFGMAGLFIAAFVYLMIRSNCPDAMDHWKAKRAGKVICRVHYRGKSTVDYIAEEDKSEREVGTTYWKVPRIGLKFKPEADSIHFIEGSVPCCDYYESMPKSIKLETAVAFSQLKDYFKKIGIPIEGIEDLAFFVSSETDKNGYDEAIQDARIYSEETKQAIQKYIQVVNSNKEQLKTMRLESGVFTWQTAMNALDSTIAYTSASLTHTIETVRAAALRREENRKKDLIMYAIIAFILCIGAAAFLYAIKGLN